MNSREEGRETDLRLKPEVFYLLPVPRAEYTVTVARPANVLGRLRPTKPARQNCW